MFGYNWSFADAQPGIDFQISVTAVLASGASSTVINASLTTASTAPTAPTGLGISSTTADAISVFYNSSEPNGAPIQGYAARPPPSLYGRYTVYAPPS